MRAAILKDRRLYRVQLNDGETETCVHAACSTLGAWLSKCRGACIARR
jgi:hypothetical protein